MGDIPIVVLISFRFLCRQNLNLTYISTFKVALSRVLILDCISATERKYWWRNGDKDFPIHGIPACSLVYHRLFVALKRRFSDDVADMNTQIAIVVYERIQSDEWKCSNPFLKRKFPSQIAIDTDFICTFALSLDFRCFLNAVQRQVKFPTHERNVFGDIKI